MCTLKGLNPKTNNEIEYFLQRITKNLYMFVYFSIHSTYISTTLGHFCGGFKKSIKF